MKAIIDTSSWISLVRYYLPFDNKSVLIDFFEKKLNNGNLVIVDAVQTECLYIAKGIVIDSFDFMKSSKKHIKTNQLIPTTKFYNLLENQFCIQVQKRKLSEVQFENEKDNFLKSADGRIILQAIELKKSLLNDVFVVTEETSTNNDHKIFKKIPAICELVNVKCITLPKLIQKFDNELKIKVKNTSA